MIQTLADTHYIVLLPVHCASAEAQYDQRRI